MQVNEWVLQWQKKMGKFLTTQEKEKVEKCKKQVIILLCVFYLVFKLVAPFIIAT